MSTTSTEKGDRAAASPATPGTKPRSTVKKVLLTIAIALAVIVGGFAVVVAMKSDDFRVTRSASMAAPASEVFAQVNDFHNWNNWSPWAKLDPNAMYTFEGPPSGEGAIYRWAGNDKVGEGDMTITESRPNERIRMKLHFIKPMEDTSDTEFTFKPAGEQTTVTWTMSGKHQNFIGKAMCFVMNMDKMIGDNFDEGLANIKAIVEKPGEAKANDEGRKPNDESSTKSE